MLKPTLIAAAAMLSAPALAQPVIVNGAPTDLPSVRVSFADLNIGSAAGRSSLERRIDVAAAHVCSDAPARMGLDDTMSIRGCVVRAKASGRRQIDTLLAARANGIHLAEATLIVSPK